MFIILIDQQLLLGSPPRFPPQFLSEKEIICLFEFLPTVTQSQRSRALYRVKSKVTVDES